MTRPFRVPAFIFACLAFAVLTGCSSKFLGSDTEPSAKTPRTSTQRGLKPYTIKGKTYYPLRDGSGYSESGVASWYGKDFHGKTTANGETYNMYSMTAAHKILPFGTQLRVTNLGNNRSIVVRINDRGPFVADRIIDLTRTGAEQLDMIGPGTARVRLESIGTIAGQRGNDLEGSFYVQVGAFAQSANAHKFAKTLQSKGLRSRVMFVPEISFHRVQIGPYPTLNTAERVAETLRGEYPGNFVVAQ